jgi:hypothetical protein
MGYTGLLESTSSGGHVPGSAIPSLQRVRIRNRNHGADLNRKYFIRRLNVSMGGVAFLQNWHFMRLGTAPVQEGTVIFEPIG